MIIPWADRDVRASKMVDCETDKMVDLLEVSL